MTQSITQDDSKIILDCTHMICPLPMLKLQQKWRIMTENEIICCITTDSKAPSDIKNFITEQDAVLLQHHQQDGKDYMTIQKIKPI